MGPLLGRRAERVEPGSRWKARRRRRRHFASGLPPSGRSALWIVLLLLLGATSALGDILGNLVLDRRSTANAVPAVVFPHWKHRSRFRCYVCHPDPFQMKAGADDITMDALRAGQFCGRCHDGRTAFAIGFDTCRTCHSHAEP